MATDALGPDDVAAGRFAGGGYAFFRLPGELTYTFVAQRDAPAAIDAPADWERLAGVVVAPFQQTAATPLVLIRPDVLTVADVPLGPGAPAVAFTTDADERRRAYGRGFEECMRRLRGDELRKVVYSRRLRLTVAAGALNPVGLFFDACRLQPHCYVSLWWTPRTGCWLVATPETLLAADEAAPGTWRTMALAGTMPWRGRLLHLDEWSEKNREEQACVVRYIERQLEGLVGEAPCLSACRSSRAAGVMHLRTDFTFRLKAGVSLGALLGRLHPTPAVCGDPLMPARCAIRAAETSPRRYYAGFSGPLGLNGHTGFYVSLRCMELLADGAMLYAGGGLLAASREEEEWDETCRKLRPMLQLFEGRGND